MNTVNLLPLALRRALNEPDHSAVSRASWKLDMMAIEYGFAVIRKSDSQPRHMRNLKRAAIELAAALKADEEKHENVSLGETST